MAWKKIDARARTDEGGELVSPLSVRLDGTHGLITFTQEHGDRLGLEPGAEYDLLVDVQDCLIGIVKSFRGEGRPAKLRQYAGRTQLNSRRVFHEMGLGQSQFRAAAYRDGDIVVINLKEKIEYRKPGDRAYPR